MMKTRKIALALILALVISVCIAPATHAVTNGWVWQQEVAHQIADLARSLGLSETHPVIIVCQDLWWAYHDGKDPNTIGFYSSNRTGNAYGYSANGTIYCSGKDLATGLSYRYDGYIWYQSCSNYQYFRIDGNKLVWATSSQNDSIPRYGTWNGNGKFPVDGWYTNVVDKNTGNLAIYNNGKYSKFGDKELYNGINTGIDQYINTNEALCLAKLMYTAGYSEKSLTKIAAIGWSAADYIGDGNITATKLKQVYSFYDDNASTKDEQGRDYLALAKDILYRRAAEKAGMTNVGRVISSDYKYIWQYGNGTCDIYTDSSRSSAYKFPNMWTANNVLSTPYNT